MYVLLNTIITKLLGFQNIKELYHDDIEFCTIYEAYEVSPINKFFRHDGFLHKENKFNVPNCFIHELLLREAYGGGLIGYFENVKTIDVFHEYFIGLI